MSSGVQGNYVDQAWAHNLPGYFKENVKPSVANDAFLIPRDNIAIPNIVTMSTQGAGAVAITGGSVVGITDIASMTLDKYRQTTGFPTVTIEKSLDGITYNVAQTLTTPGSAATWTGQTITALSLSGTFPNLQFKQTGTLAAYSGNKALAEIQGCTLTLNSAYDPNAIVRSEQNTYYLEAKISNTTTGDAFYITLAMKLNDVLTINCVERSVTLQDGTRMQAAIRLDSDRVDWLRFAFGTNTLEFEDDGTLGITVDTTWSDKVVV